MIIQEKDVRFKAVRSQGPGGQNTNRRATKVQLWIKISDLPVSEREKKIVRRKIPRHHLNRNDEIEVWAEEERTQELNRKRALQRLNYIVESAMKKPTPRIPTEPLRSVEDERIGEKKIISQKKQSRRLSHHPVKLKK
jgi:ribosome-associated protein